MEDKDVIRKTGLINGASENNAAAAEDAAADAAAAEDAAVGAAAAEDEEDLYAEIDDRPRPIATRGGVIYSTKNNI